MSMQYWTNQGYGIQASDIHTTADKIRELIHMAPNFEAYAKSLVLKENNFERSIEDMDLDYFLYDFYDNSGNACGISTILANVMTEKEGLFFYACENWDNDQFVLHLNGQPWEFRNGLENMTSEDMDNIFAKYVAILTDEEIFPDYQAVENGG